MISRKHPASGITARVAFVLSCVLASACGAVEPPEPSANTAPGSPNPNDDATPKLPETPDGEDEGPKAPDPVPTPPPPTDALSLARIDRNGAVHTLLVLGATDIEVEAVDLSMALNETPTYPLDLVVKHGFDAIAKLATSDKKEKIALTSLRVPIEEGSSQICAGVNYVDHQAETGNDGVQPFLFPKVVKPTAFDTKIERQKGELLDYEVELCVAYGKDITTEADLANNPVAFAVCNDVSERATQILNLDNANQASGKGFTDAKSRAGFLPLGPWLVVPKDPIAFTDKATLALSRNGVKKQGDLTKNMIWKTDRIVKEALALGKDPRFELGGKKIALLPEGKITRGTILLTGTPGGVILKAPTAQFKAIKAAEWAFSGSFFTTDVETYVKQEFVAELRKKSEFLLPGEIVQADATGTGSLHYTITGSKD